MTSPRVLFEGLGDITDIVVFSQTMLNIAAQGEAQGSTMIVKDVGDSAMEFVTGSRITVDLDGDVIWAGFLVRASRRFWFDVDSQTTSNRQWALDLADLNLLFSKRIVGKQSSPKVIDGPSYRSATYDDTIIGELLANWLDLSTDDLDTSSLVDRVAIVNPSSGACVPADQTFYPFNGSMQWGEAMGVIAQVPAAVWGLVPGAPLGSSPFGKLFYADADGETAPFDLVDNVTTSGQAGYRDMTIWDDGTNLVNESFAWGAGKGTDHLVFDHRTAAASVTAHGLWQEGDLLYNIWCQDTIEKVTDSIINGSPTSRRGHKNPVASIECETDTDGLRVGHKVRFVNAGYGIDEVFPIRKMGISFPVPDRARYKLTLSEELDEWGFQNPPLPFKGFRFGHIPKIVFPPIDLVYACDCGITDTFSRFEAGGWGLSDSAVGWQIVSGSAVWGVDGVGTVTMAAANSSVISLGANLQNLTTLPITGTIKVVVQEFAGSNRNAIRFTLGSGFGDDAISILLPTTGSANGQLKASVFGTGMGTAVDYTFGGAGTYMVRFLLDQTGVYGRIWLDGSSEPGSWQAYRTVSGGLEAGVEGTFRIALSGASTTDWDLSFDDLDIDGVNRCTQFRFDNFNRSSVGTFGVSDLGVPWQQFVDTYIVDSLGCDGSVAFWHTTPTRTYAEAYQEWPAGTAPWTSGKWVMSTRFQFADLLTSVDRVYFIVQSAGTLDVVQLTLTHNNSSGSADPTTGFFTGSVALSGPSVHGAGIVVAKSDWVPDAWYRVVWDYEKGVHARAKVWLETDPEPGAWTVEGTDDGTIDLGVVDTVFHMVSNGAAPPSMSTKKFDYINFDYAGKPCYMGHCAIETFSHDETDGWGTSEILGIPWRFNQAPPQPNYYVSDGRAHIDANNYLWLNFDTGALTAPINILVLMKEDPVDGQGDISFFLERSFVPADPGSGHLNDSYIQFTLNALSFDSSFYPSVRIDRDLPEADWYDEYPFDLTGFWDGAPFYVRMIVDATSAKIRMWRADGAEPSEWHASVSVDLSTFLSNVNMFTVGDGYGSAYIDSIEFVEGLCDNAVGPVLVP